MRASKRTLRFGIGLSSLILLTGAVVYFATRGPAGTAGDPRDEAQRRRGQNLYAQHCASCHGAALEGQPNWRQRLPSGRLPAPPHDATGHTWHHPDRILFEITKYGVERFAPAGYQSDMPAFAGVLGDDEIWAVLAYIKSQWPEQVRASQAEATRRDSSG